ncbi:MAG: S-layer protein, partial [Phycisphaerae bacterium]
MTARALFESNDRAMAEVDERGVVRILDLPGKVAVMVRYQGRVAVINASVPLGAPVETVPPSKNFIDELVFANLKEIGIPPSPVCDDATFIRRVTLD